MIEAINILLNQCSLKEVKEVVGGMDKLLEKKVEETSEETRRIYNLPHFCEEIGGEVGGKLCAVKYLKDQTGLGLKDAKALTEAICEPSKSFDDLINVLRKINQISF